MKNNEQTQYDETLHTNNDERTSLDETPKAPSADAKKRGKGLRFGAGLGAAAAAGAGATILSGSMTKQAADKQEAEAASEHQETNDEVPAWSDGEVAVATGDYDDMSFSEAFAAARAEVGPGGAFEWHGKVYGTYLRDEWQNMSASERAEYESHFSWSNHSSSSAPHDNYADNAPTATVDGDDSDDLTAEVVGDDATSEVSLDNESTDDVPVVEVLGVAHNDEYDANVAVLSVDDNEVLLVDMDNDETFDILAADINGDGSVSTDEMYDISDNNLTVSDLGGFTEPEV